MLGRHVMNGKALAHNMQHEAGNLERWSRDQAMNTASHLVCICKHADSLCNGRKSRCQVLHSQCTVVCRHDQAWAQVLDACFLSLHSQPGR